jgi:hypothetical protein
MGNSQDTKQGPDLSQGIRLDQLADGKMLVGHVGGENVLLVRRDQEIFAVGAHCTHYRGPLADGLVVGEAKSIWMTLKMPRKRPLIGSSKNSDRLRKKVRSFEPNLSHVRLRGVQTTIRRNPERRPHGIPMFLAALFANKNLAVRIEGKFCRPMQLEK